MISFAKTLSTIADVNPVKSELNLKTNRALQKYIDKLELVRKFKNATAAYKTLDVVRY